MRLRSTAALALLLGLAACSDDREPNTTGSRDAGRADARAAIDAAAPAEDAAAADAAELPDAGEALDAAGARDASAGPTADPPTSFTCPSPGAGTEPVYTALVAHPWYYVWNDRTCGEAGWKMIYLFRPDGVLVVRSQFLATPTTRGGDVDYGCWTYDLPASGRIRVQYSWANTTLKNCTMVARLSDPPCTGVLEQRDPNFVLADALDRDQETHLLRPLPEATCTWCNTATTCCPEPGWIADSSGPICP
jgi:hypothetical protein